ncbi:MAG: histidine triad nucleotide-binding protein [Verrucomicrobiota bacterium]|nr:histidine triad nucleotide-binding protein [Verrucomicrobiota bacterium]
MSKTLFERICNRELPGDIVWEDNLVVAFRDINPRAPVHVLVVPRRPIPRLSDAKPEDKELLGHVLLAAAKVAEVLGLKNGYRLVLNTGRDAGEAIPHLHFHLIGGRRMRWPPG